MGSFTADKLVQMVRSSGNQLSGNQPLGNQPDKKAISQNAPDLDDTDLLILLGYDAKTGTASVCPRNWKRHGLHQIHVSASDILSKSIQDLADLNADLNPTEKTPDFNLSSVESLFKSQEAATGSTSGASVDNHDLGPSERWITVHPHGEDGKGVPVKIKRNHDKSWSVAGGAGGKINGLRLVHVKSPEEYKTLGKERARQRREKEEQEKAKHFEGIKEKHRESLRAEAQATGESFTPEHIEKEAHKRATQEITKTREAQTKATADIEAQKQKVIDEHLTEIAKAQGWDTSAFQISEQNLKELQSQKESEILANNPKLRARLASENPNTVAAAREELQKQAGQLVQKVQAKHQKLVLRRVLELGENLSDLVASTADGISHETMGDVSIGDLVKETLGDSGKGYVADLKTQAEARGMALPDAKAQAEAQNRQSRLERHGFNLDSAARSEQFVQRVQEGAAAAREEVRRAAEQLGEKGEGPLGKIQSLDTMPKVTDMKSAVETLSRLKQLKATLATSDEEKQRIEEAKSLDEIPKAAVVHATPLSHEEALQQVLDDLSKPGEREAEKERQRAMGDLIDCYNAQDAIAPLVSHRLSGHNALFGNVAQIAGVRGPDPLMADILGPEGTAHVLRRALELSTNGDAAKAQGLRDGLESHHIETQISVADMAVEHAKELMNQAENLEDFPLDSVDALMAGLDQAKQKNDLVRQAREHLGVALGKLEAGAALNFAFMGKPKDEVQIPLGALSTEDALIKAGAAGLTKADVFDENSGELKEAGHFRIYNDGKNKFLVIHQEGLQHLAHSLQEDPEHLKRLQLASDIKAGKHDEQNWLPKGFSPRPKTDVSALDYLPLVNTKAPLSIEASDGIEEMAPKIKAHIGERLSKGAIPADVRRDLCDEHFMQDSVRADREKYLEAIRTVLPVLSSKPDGKPPTQQERMAHQDKLNTIMQDCMKDYVNQKITDGTLDRPLQAIYKQTLPVTWQTKDIAVQAVLQDPRLQHCFKRVGDLTHRDLKAIRSYALEKILTDADGKPISSKEKPIFHLPASKMHAWEVWQTLGKQHRHGGSPYKEIQQHLREHLENQRPQSNDDFGSMFGEEFQEPEDPKTLLANVELDDPTAVIRAAKNNADLLGYAPMAVINSDGTYHNAYPEFETADNRTEAEVARKARRRIEGYLRSHAFTEMPHFRRAVTEGDSAQTLGGVPQVTREVNGVKVSLPAPQNVFNPDDVPTAGGSRWAHYVADIGGEVRAYHSILEKMKGDFLGRFAKGMRGQGNPVEILPVPLKYAEAHALAQMDYETRERYRSQLRSDADRFRARDNGRYAKQDYSVREAQEAEKENTDQFSAFSSDTGKNESFKLDQHRLSMGRAVENTLASIMPTINLKKGTVAAGDIDMSSAEGVKRQRAIKQIEAMQRVGLTLGVGCVHESTLIEDAISGETQTIQQWMLQDRAPRVWALNDNKQAVISQASAPFIKATAPMFRVRTESGREIIVTAAHRFLAPDGWEHLENLALGSLIASFSENCFGDLLLNEASTGFASLFRRSLLKLRRFVCRLNFLSASE